jgi:L-amino acid N-acyltransferase YncA
VPFLSAGLRIKLYTFDVKENMNKSIEMKIREAVSSDAEAIAEIYNHYVRQTIITFEENYVPPTELIKRIQQIQSIRLPWLIAESNDKILGYACAGKWKERAAYRFSVETTVYVQPNCLKEGIGSGLYNRLMDALKAKGYHAAMGGIALPNKASVGLHEKLGFKKVAHFTEVGYKFDRWIDVGYWQRIL